MCRIEIEQRERMMEAFKRQFLTKNLSNNNFIRAISLGMTKADFKTLAGGDAELEDYLNSVLLPYLNNQDKAAWTRATSINTVAAYMEYLKRFGDNALHAAEARKEIQAGEEAVWKGVETAQDEVTLKAAIDTYLKSYPEGIHADEACAIMEDIPWEIATRTDTIDVYEQYLAQRPDSPHAPEARDRIEHKKDELDWLAAKRSGRREDYFNYLNNHPNGDYRNDAQAAISDIDNNPRLQYLEMLRNDPNARGCYDIQQKVASGPVTWEDIAGIFGEERKEAIRTFKTPDDLPRVTGSETLRGYTEVYFWGLRGSGKTCAIGATIGYLSRTPGYRVVDLEGAGQKYFRQLQRLFIMEGICSLPVGTNMGNLPYMPFLFKNGDGSTHGDGKWRQAQIIDVAGETFTGIYRKQNNLYLDPDSEQAKAADAIERMLRDGHNNKVHFFIIEYGDDGNNEENKCDIGGGEKIPRCMVMQSLLDYFIQNNTLARSTYRLYALVTKSDRIAPPTDHNVSVSDNRKWEAVRFVKRTGWVDVMDRIEHLSRGLHCGPAKIPQAFSIGDVFAKDLAEFSREDAKAVVEAVAAACTPRPDPYSFAGWVYDAMNK